MANDKIEDVIRKVVLGESFMAEEQDAVPGPGDDEDTIRTVTTNSSRKK